MERFIFRKPVIFLLFLGLLITGFFVLVPLAKAESAPPAINYAPNFWFDSQEQYYPVNPLDFYFENGIEISGQMAVNKYNQLSLEAKIENMTVLYHILDYGDQWVYQYWCFYVFNDFPGIIKNEHYGDWEAIFVFVDKESKEIIKAIGTAHQRKFFDTEIYEPSNNHIWAYVGSGSHANCIDENPDGNCNSLKWKVLESWDKKGYRVTYSNYNLQEITLDFIKIFEGATTLKESSELGINPFDYLGIDKEFYIPLGGSPSTHAWAQSNYYNPDELRPISWQYALDKASQASNKIAGFFSNLVTGIGGFFKGLGGSQEADISKIIERQSEGSAESEPVSEIGTAELPLSEPVRETFPKSMKPAAKEPIIQKTEEISPFSEIIKPKIEGDEEEKPISQEESPIKPPSFISGGGGGGGPSSFTTPPLLPPKIISPNSGALFGQQDDYATSTSDFEVNLIGTSTPAYQILIFISSTSTPDYSTTTDSQGDWQQVVILEEGANTIKVKAQDDNNNESEDTLLNLIVDTTPPSVVSNLSATSGVSRGTVALSWTAPGDSVSVSEYIIRYSTSSEITDLNWASSTDVDGEPSPSSPRTTENLSIDGLSAGERYFFAIKSKDGKENISAISNSPNAIASALAENVVINEVQIGTDEFAELYNPTNNPVNMSEWYWAYFSSNRDWNNPYLKQPFPNDAIIPAGGYYLIGLSGYATTSDLVAADWQPYASQQLHYQKGSVAIFSSEIPTTTPELAIEKCIDAVGWGSVNHVREGNSAPAAVSNKTLVRQTLGWDTDDNSANFIESDWPTPRNSKDERVALIADEFSFSQDIVWTKEDSPYVLYSNLGKHPTVQDGATLTIEPGVVIKGSNKSYSSLIIQGALKAEGTNSEPITFTTATTTQMAGNWSGIVFDNSTSTESVLDYVNFTYGGYDAVYKRAGVNFSVKEMIWVNNSQVEIKNSSFKNSQHNSIRLVNSSSAISDSVFENNALTGIIIDGSSPSVNNSQFINNGKGMEIINQASPTIDSNSFSENDYSIYLKSAYPILSGNTASDNITNGVVIDQESIFSQNASWTADLPFVLNAGFGQCPTVASGTVLTLEPGVVVKSDRPYTALLIEGNLTAQGTDSLPIVFTSLKDDTRGGDTNNDDGATTPATDNWKNIRFVAGSEGILDFVGFYYGESGGLEIDLLSNIIVGDIIY